MLTVLSFSVFESYSYKYYYICTCIVNHWPCQMTLWLDKDFNNKKRKYSLFLHRESLKKVRWVSIHQTPTSWLESSAFLWFALPNQSFPSSCRLKFFLLLCKNWLTSYQGWQKSGFLKTNPTGFFSSYFKSFFKCLRSI